MSLNENRIRECAYQLWEQEGKPEGCADEHWYKAYKSVEAEYQLSPTNSETHADEHFIPHQNTKKGKHVHHSHQPH